MFHEALTELHSGTNSCSEIHSGTNCSEKEPFKDNIFYGTMSKTEDGIFKTVLEDYIEYESNKEWKKIRMIADNRDIPLMTSNWTGLMYAAGYGNLDIVKFLVAVGSAVNESRPFPWAPCINVTPLVIAAVSGWTDIVDFLLRHDAKIDNRGCELSVLALSLDSGHFKTAELLFMARNKTVMQEDFQYAIRIKSYMVLSHLLVLKKHRLISKDYVDQIWQNYDNENKNSQVKDEILKEIDNLNKCDYVLELHKSCFPQKIFDELKSAIKHSIMFLEYLRPHIPILTALCDRVPWNEMLLFNSESKMVLMNQESVQLRDLDFDKNAVLGHGSYGTVFQGSSLNCDGDCLRLAVKVASLADRTFDPLVYIYEANKLKHFQHKNVLRFYGLTVERSGRIPYLCLVTELCKEDLKVHFITDGQKLFRNPGKLTNSSDGGLCLSYYKNVCQQVLNGLKYLHENDTIHKDIKLSNIFITSDRIIKIGDFGLAKYVNNGFEMTNTFSGTEMYSAPELLCRPCRYSAASDLFAFGLAMFEMYYGEVYFSMLTPVSKHDVGEFIKSGGRPKFVELVPPKSIRSFIEQCWEQNSSKRPTTYKME